MLFSICVVLVLVVSLLTRPPAAAQLEGLTYATVTADQRRASRSSWSKWDVLCTASILGLIVCTYLYFTG